MSEHPPATPESRAAGFMPDTSYDYIDTRDGLRRYLDAIADDKFVYMDLEADNLHHYKEQLCLIQLHGAGKTALVDPLALDSCQDLLEFLDDPQRELWMHGADFDMMLMLASFDWLPTRIHDTQIAAQLVGRRQFGLAALVHHYLGYTMSKSSQKDDWSRRPLTPRMLEYAAIDASILPHVRAKLVGELETTGRWDWFLQGCAQSRRQALTRPPRDEDLIWRVQGWGGLKGRALAYLRALWFWRDDEAARRDVPTFKVLSNQELLVMAAQLDSDGRCEVRRRLTHDARDELRQLATDVRTLPEEQWPGRTKVVRKAKPKDFEEKVDLWRARRDKIAHELGIEPTVLANRRTLEILALGEATDETPNLQRWQRELLEVQP